MTTNIPIVGSDTGAYYDTASKEIKLPKQEQINPDISTAQGRTSYYQQFIADEEARATKAEEDRQQAIKDRESQRTKQGGIIDLIKGTGTKRTEELTSLGFNPIQQFAQQKAQLAEVDSLYQDYNSAVAQRDQALANVENRTGGTLDFMNAESARINRNANVILTQKSSNINSKLAIMEAQNNNFESAQKFVDQSIKDYTAGLTADYNMLESFIDDNNDLISSLGTEYTNALNSRKSLILDQIETAKSDKQQEIDNDFKREGLDLQWAQENRLGRESVGVSGSGVANSKVEASFREDGASLKQQVRAKVLTNEEAYAQLRDLYSPNEVSDKYINDYLGITTPTSTNQIAETTSVNKLQQRVKEKQDQNMKMGFNKNLGLREELIKEGFNPQDVYNSTQDSMERVDSFVNEIYKSIFGK